MNLNSQNKNLDNNSGDNSEYKKEKVDKNYEPSNLFFKGYKNDKMLKELAEEKDELKPEDIIDSRVKLIPRERKTEAKSDDTVKKGVVPPIPLLEGDENEFVQIQAIAPPEVFLAQIKSGNNSNKLINEIGQKLYRLYQHNKITTKFYNNLTQPL